MRRVHSVARFQADYGLLSSTSGWLDRYRLPPGGIQDRLETPEFVGQGGAPRLGERIESTLGPARFSLAGRCAHGLDPRPFLEPLDRFVERARAQHDAPLSAFFHLLTDAVPVPGPIGEGQQDF